VLAGFRDAADGARVGVAEPVGHPYHRPLLPVAVGDLDDGAAPGHGRRGQDILGVPDVRPGQPGGFQVALERVAVLVGGEPRGHDPGPGAQLVLERSVRIGVGHAEAGLQLVPEVLAVGGDEDRAAGRGPHFAASRPDRVLVDAVVGVVIGGEHRLEHAQVDVLAGPGAVAQPQCGQDGDRAVQPGQRVGERERDIGGRVACDVGLASDQPGFGVDDGRVRRPSGIVTVPAEAGDGQHHQPRVDGGQGDPAGPEPVQHARPEVLHQHVAGGGEVEQPGHVGFLVQVEHDRALARVDVRVQPGTAAGHLAERLRDVGAGQLGPDHVGAEIGQDPAGERAGHRPRQVEHAQAVQGPGLLAGPLRHGRRPSTTGAGRGRARRGS
jgi:hypothetical protein